MGRDGELVSSHCKSWQTWPGAARDHSSQREVPQEPHCQVRATVTVSTRKHTHTPALKVFTGIISSYYLLQEICPATWECASVRHRFSPAMDEEESPKAMQLNFWGQKKKRLSQARWAGAGSAQRTSVAADANTAPPGVTEVTWDPLPERQPVLQWFQSLPSPN